MGSAKQTTSGQAPAGPHTGNEPTIEADTLVEEISIDGMCGVY